MAAGQLPRRHGTVGGGLAVSIAVVAGLLLLTALSDALLDGAISDGVRRVATAAAIVSIAAAAVGLYDDLHGDPAAKGFRGHLRALRARRVTSGLIKVVVIVAGAVVAAVVLGEGDLGAQQLVDAGVIAGTANMANLLDLRPGRALKALLVVAVPLTFAAGPATGLVAAWPTGVAAGMLPTDLGERSMLGDGGANVLGAALGTALAAAGGLATSLAVLAGLVAATAASEVVSFSAVIERNPVLRRLDLLGRSR